MTSSEAFYRIAAEDMVRTAAQAMASANEFLRLAEQVRLTAEREAYERPLADEGGGSEVPPGAFEPPLLRAVPS